MILARVLFNGMNNQQKQIFLEEGISLLSVKANKTMNSISIECTNIEIEISKINQIIKQNDLDIQILGRC